MSSHASDLPEDTSSVNSLSDSSSAAFSAIGKGTTPKSKSGVLAPHNSDYGRGFAKGFTAGFSAGFEQGKKIKLIARGTHAVQAAEERLTQTAEHAAIRVGKVLEGVIKPSLRGWIHLGVTPLAIAAAIVLISLAPSSHNRLAAIAFGITSVLLFATSATFHRGSWGPRTYEVLRRMDHANIFLIIAGSYTPFAMTLLPREAGIELLWIAWAGAIMGLLFRVFWLSAPRWLYTPIYVALGWVAVFYFPDLLRGGGPAVVTLIVVGGVLYTIGAVVYGVKKPDPSPKHFGFHEVFHVLTVAAYVCHYIAASFAIYANPHPWG